MPLRPPPSQCTRLEHLAFDRDGVNFDLDGRFVRLSRETAAPAFAALQAFHQSALADYEAHARSSARPGWFSRLRTWLARLIGGDGPKAPEAAPPVPRVPGPPGAEPRSEPSASGPGSRISTQPPAGAAAHRASVAPAAEVPEAASPREKTFGARRAPLLRAVFAEPGGVRLIWQPQGSRSPAGEIERIHPLDSELARRLGDCYDQLDRLGYRIVGLDLLKAVPPDQPVIAAAAPAARAPSPQATGPAAPNRKEDPSMVARLLPDDSDQPNRALVRRVGEAEAADILVAPEKVLRALRAAADPARPAEERLTFLRCAPAKSGVRVAEVGLGKGGEDGPARWEGLAPWLARQQPQASPGKPRPAAEPPPNRPAGEPELGL